MAKAKSKVVSSEAAPVATEVQVRVDSFAKGIQQLSELYKIGIVLTLNYGATQLKPEMRFQDITPKENEDKDKPAGPKEV